MRRPLVVANWKMNGSIASIDSLVGDLVVGLESVGSGSEIVLCPPSLYVPQTHKLIDETNIHLGAQNSYHKEKGAFTGEISPTMLKDFSCEYVILGHSERRLLFGETDQEIADKFCFVHKNGLKPILCIGETAVERDLGETFNRIDSQLDVILTTMDIDVFASAVIAYEPVWAIGTGVTATPEQAQEVHAYIRQKLAKIDQKMAENISIIYGGSVKSENAMQLFGQPDIDGGLIGGASLNSKEFIDICLKTIHTEE